MKVILTKQFKKNYKKRIQPHPSKDSRFEKRLGQFIKDPNNPILRDHALKGKKQTFRAFSVAGDLRVVYYLRNGDAVFLDIGSHNQVY